jgi:hypothetical protein
VQLCHPIIINDERTLIDGRNRWWACEKLRTREKLEIRPATRICTGRASKQGRLPEVIDERRRDHCDAGQASDQAT